MPYASILTIGNELVSGDVVNTNAAWLARRLAPLGVAVRLTASLPDEIDAIAEFVRTEAARVDFLPDAAKLAERGAVAMTIDSPFTRSTDEDVQAGYEDRPTTRRLMIQNVKDLVRGLDVLVERYDVDPERVAIVGYSMGAQPAVLAAAADPRVRALVVMAGRAKPSGPAGDPEVERLFVPLNTERFIGHVAPARILLQGGRRDAIIPRSDMETLFARASEPKEIRWYKAGHELGTKADADRIRWLSAALGLR